ncbi:MAG: FAD-dependent oxidoreductase, partial [Planctomycetota bacterium]
SAGAETQFDTLVHRWRDDGSAISMETSHGTFTCDRLVIAAGPWAGQMLADLGAPLQLRRQSLFWFEAPANHSFHKMPPFLFEDPQGAYYGFPATSPFGVKVGDHGYGQPLASPEAIDRDIDPSDQQRLEAFVARRLPGVSQSITNHATCYYTMSPDEHFLVDRLPSDERICFAAGLSGHGYKFAPVLGEALADLATEGSTALPVDFLSARRFTTH